MTIVNWDVGNFFFLYGYGGIGKTYLWKLLSAAIRAKGMIALNVASSGIASLLLPGGKTAHSTFCIPLEINDEWTCNINQGSLRAKLLMEINLSYGMKLLRWISYVSKLLIEHWETLWDLEMKIMLTNHWWKGCCLGQWF